VPVHEMADDLVHALYEGEATAFDRGGISGNDAGQQGPTRQTRQTCDRRCGRDRAPGNRSSSLVAAAREGSSARPSVNGAAVALLDIPVALMKTKGEARCDAVVW